jgi:hypothetical protein
LTLTDFRKSAHPLQALTAHFFHQTFYLYKVKLKLSQEGAIKIEIQVVQVQAIIQIIFLCGLCDSLRLGEKPSLWFTQRRKGPQSSQKRVLASTGWRPAQLSIIKPLIIALVPFHPRHASCATNSDLLRMGVRCAQFHHA